MWNVFKGHYAFPDFQNLCMAILLDLCFCEIFPNLRNGNLAWASSVYASFVTLIFDPHSCSLDSLKITEWCIFFYFFNAEHLGIFSYVKFSKSVDLCKVAFGCELDLSIYDACSQLHCGLLCCFTSVWYFVSLSIWNVKRIQ